MCRRTRHIPFLEHEVCEDQDKVRRSTILHSGTTSAQLSDHKPYCKDRIHTSVPQSSTTGNVLDGCIPAHNVVITSLATEIKIPPTPDVNRSVKTNDVPHVSPTLIANPKDLRSVQLVRRMACISMVVAVLPPRPSQRCSRYHPRLPTAPDYPPHGLGQGYLGSTLLACGIVSKNSGWPRLQSAYR